MVGNKCVCLYSGIKTFSIFQLLCLIGEAYDDNSDEICGAVVNIRGKGDKLAMWTANAQNFNATKAIG